MPNPKRIGAYEVLELLGRGGMAEVYRARYRGAAGAEREVVLKQVLPFAEEDPTHIELFIAEARLTLKLSHGNIVQVFEFGEEDGRYYIVMELIDGVSLADLLKASRKAGLAALPAPIAVAVMQHVCRGLHYAHTRKDERGQPLKIVHRDVSPDNVLLGFDGQVKLADFGIARAAMVGRTLTDPGVFRGKFSYSAPEQARAEEVDARSDVYSAGVVLSQCLLGLNPQKAMALQIAAGTQRIPRFPQELAGAELAKIIDSAVAPEPDDRPSSALEFEQRLASWAAKTPVFAGHDLLMESLAFCFPNEARARGHTCSPEVRTWLMETARPPPPVKATAKTVETRASGAAVKRPPEPGGFTSSELWKGGAVVGVIALVVGILWARGDFVHDETVASPLELKAAEPGPRPIPMPRPRPAPEPATVQAPVVEVPALPREAHSAPASIVLSSITHGLNLAEVGLTLKPPDPTRPWAVRTIVTERRLDADPLLFGAVLGSAGQLTGIVTVPKEWMSIDGQALRVFRLIVSGFPGPPFDVAVASRTSNVWMELPALHRKNIYFDATAGSDLRQFVLTDLRRDEHYELRVLAAPGLPLGPVIAAFTFERFASGEASQVLLRANSTLKVSGVTRIVFAMPVLPGAPEARAIVEVTVAESARVERAPPPRSEADRAERAGLDADARGEFGVAATQYELCFKKDPKRTRCREAATQSRRMLKLTR